MKRLKIDVDYMQDILRRLLGIPSPTGYTDEIVRFACEELTRLGVPFEVTRRGAIRACVEGARHRPARAIIAHLDTLGAQVKALKDNGRLEIVAIGHWSARFAEGARVTVLTLKGSFRGTILPLKASGHTYNEEIDTQPVAWTNLEVRVDAWPKPLATSRTWVSTSAISSRWIPSRSFSTTASSSRAIWTTRRASRSCSPASRR